MHIYIKEVNDKDAKFKVGDHVRMSKYKNIFAKGYIPHWSEDIFVIKDVKNTVPWTDVINDLMVKKLLEHFIKKNCKKQIDKDLGQKKSLKEKEMNDMLNGKDIIYIIAGLIKKT